ncbi:MAG TPA: YqgE/AlgH family protein [Vicinamibacterales bacterium]|jgi:putative transcriptional regulator|nr:YqgE/AlgH family protein [Vicinamibacterales bacterium]
MSLAPTLLLSMPQLQDPNFVRAVILLCEHEPDGAFGLVLNRPTDVAAASVVRLDPPLSEDSGLVLWMGGPVEPQRGWILLGEEPSGTDARRIVDGVYLSASPVLLRRVLEERPAPRARVLAGYAGWGPKQLDGELEQSSWLLADVQPDLIFDVDALTMWETAIRRLGADPTALQMSKGVH